MRSLLSPDLPLPDLTVSLFQIRISNDGITPEVVSQTNNVGAGPAADSATGLFLSTDSTVTTDDTFLASSSTGGIAAGGHDPGDFFGFPFTGAQVRGTYYLAAIADVLSQVQEGDEGNNVSNVVKIILGTNAGEHIAGTSGDDTIFGLNGNDLLIAGAGNDVLVGGGGSDGFQFAAGDFNSADVVNGGNDPGTLDRLIFTTPGTIGAGAFANVTHVEQIALAPGTNNLTVPSLAADSPQITVIGNSGDDTVNASNGSSVNILAGGGNDTLTGSLGNDIFTFTTANLTGSDIVDGGGGSRNTIVITTGGGIGPAQTAGVSHIQKFYFSPDNHTMTVSDALGAVSLVGNSGTDVFIATTVTSNPITFEGVGGADKFYDGGGADRFVYLGAPDSTGNANGTAYDTFVNFNITAGDRIDLPNAGRPTSIATVSQGTLNAGTGTFDSDMAAAIGSQLGAHTAVDFHVTAGNLSGHEFLVVNPTGTAGYVSGADYVFDIAGHTGMVTTGDFI